MKPTGLPGAKKHSAANKQAKTRKIKLATNEGNYSWVRAASRAASRAVSTAVFRSRFKYSKLLLEYLYIFRNKIIFKSNVTNRRSL
jgi:hypothetical protein